jgi:hypothetical protein
MVSAAVITYLFPGIRIGPGGECLIQDDGAGPFIASWTRPEPQPTPAELAAAAHPAALAAVTAQIKTERQRRQTQLGFPVQTANGLVRFHSDEHSRSQHAGLFAAAQLTLMQGGTATTPLMSGGAQVQWSPMTGANVPLTVGVVLALLNGAMANENAIHQAAAAHIAAAALLEDPLTHDFSSDWPV